MNLKPRDLLAMTNADLADLCDLKTGALIEARATAFGHNNVDAVVTIDRELDFWGTMRDRLDRLEAAA